MKAVITRPASRTLRIDKAASEVSLEASQLGPFKLRCRFTEFEGTLALGGETELARADLQIAASSLKSAFGRSLDRLAAKVLLRAERHPWVTVSARGMRLHGNSGGEFSAAVSFRGKTRRVPLEVRLDEVRPDGGVRFRVAAAVDRRDWGAGEALPGFSIGNRVSIRAAISAVPT